MVLVLLVAVSNSLGQVDMWDRIKKALTKEEKPAPKKEEPQADFSGVTNPKRVIEKRLEKAESGMKCGGKVKKMAAGGTVRGTGCATKGTGFKGVC